MALREKRDTFCAKRVIDTRINHQTSEDQSDVMGLLSDLKTELWAILVLAGPAFVSQGTLILMAVVDSLFVGRIGPDELAASAIGSYSPFDDTKCSILATALQQSFIYIGVGLSFGMDTLVSQAFGNCEF